MTTYNLDFNLYDHSFCEMNIYGKSPEYINSFSSLCLTFFGLFGLIMNDKIHEIKMIYTAMIYNGIASFMYHFNNQLGWGLLDRFSMILIALPCYMIGVKILESLNFYSIFYDVLRFLIIFYLSYLKLNEFNKIMWHHISNHQVRLLLVLLRVFGKSLSQLVHQFFLVGLIGLSKRWRFFFCCEIFPASECDHAESDHL